MKYLTAFFFLCTVATNVIAQKHAIDKKWIGPTGEFLEINNNTAFYQSQFNDMSGYYIPHIYDTLLTLTNEKFQCLLKIVKLTGDTLMVFPLNGPATALLNTTNVDRNKKVTATFVDRAHIYDPNLSYQNIYFRSSRCRGECPSMELEIDANGKVHFHGESFTGNYIGYYDGMLSNLQLEKLNWLFKNSLPDKFDFAHVNIADVPGYYFRFHYNNKIKTANGQCVPYVGLQLRDFLLSVYKDISLQKMPGEYDFSK